MDAARLSAETELAEIVDRIRAGDSAAEDEIVRRYRQGVAIIIGQIVRSQSATEDLSQDSFKLVLEKIRKGDLREPERLSGFVRSVARNLAIEHVRRARRSRDQQEIQIAERIPDPAPNQLEEMLREERSRVVRRVIDELKMKRDREVLLRFYIGEEEKAEICADLGLTKAQFHNVIHRATARFKELYVRMSSDGER